MLVDHNPKVPNRQAAILAGGEDPSPEITAMAMRLEAAGADFLVIPCNTSHVFEAGILESVSIPLVSIIDETIAAVSERSPAARSVGLLATDGCLEANVYQEALLANKLIPVLPSDKQLNELMKLINGIKGGYQGEVVSSAMRELATALEWQGAQVIIAGCTEIPLVLKAAMLDVPLISSTDVLAQKTVQFACGDLPLPKQE